MNEVWPRLKKYFLQLGLLPVSELDKASCQCCKISTCAVIFSELQAAVGGSVRCPLPQHRPGFVAGIEVQADLDRGNVQGANGPGTKGLNFCSYRPLRGPF